jgi:hypothetical protein
MNVIEYSIHLSGLNADGISSLVNIITSVHFMYVPVGQNYHYQALTRYEL